MQAGLTQGSVLSPTLFNLYINDAPQTQGVHLALFETPPLSMRRIARRVLLENSSVVSAQWRPGVSAGI
jgi:hypothetical protein